MLGYGQNIVSARNLTFIPLGQWTANTANVKATGRFGCPVGCPNIRVVGIHFAGDAVPSDADGAMTISVKVKDISEGGVDTLVTAFNGETGLAAADQYYEATLATETSEEERTLQPGDTLYAEFTNDSAAIDTNANVYMAVEWIWVPRDQDDEDMRAYVGYPTEMAAEF